MVKLCVNFSLTALLSARFFVDNEIIPYLLFGLFRPNVDIFVVRLFFIHSHSESTQQKSTQSTHSTVKRASLFHVNSFDVRHDVAYSPTYISQHNNESVRIHSKLEILTEWHGLTWNMNRLSTPLPVLRCSHFIFHREKRRKMVCVLERRQHGRWGCQNFNHFQIILSMCFRASRAFQKKERRESFRSFFCSVEILNSILNSTRHVEWTEHEEKNSRESSWTAAII